MIQVQTPSQNVQGAGWLFKLMGLIQGITGLFLIAVALWLVISLPVWWSTAPRISLPLFVDLYPSEEVISLNPESTVIQEFKTCKTFECVVNTKFADAWVQWFYILIIGLGKIISYMFIKVLRQIVGSVAQGQAFSHANANRLHMLAIYIFSITLYESIVVAGFCYWALSGFLYLGDGMKPTGIFDVFDMDQMLIIWVLFVLGEVFRRGAEMTKEQSLTI